ncbi:MAG: nucleotide exchange factor GrpE [Acidobacteria bacterium]|nr:nucleotide exchange factor GrpE [Acidobacteriota bacterium]
MEPTEGNSGITTGAEPSEIERLKEELRHEHEMHLRALADFDNYRRRVEREGATAARSGRREVLLPLLEVLDGFDRALQRMGDAPSSMSEGLQVIHRKLLGLLEKHGVTPLRSLGEAFNPELHEAVGSVQSDKHEPGAVIDEVQRGYRWGDEVLRPARVRVAQ